MKNPKFIPPYWDEGQRGPNYYRWYAKGKYKRLGRKKWIREQLRTEYTLQLIKELI